MMSCASVPPIDKKYFTSRLYELPYERVFNAVHFRVSEYPMGVGEAAQTKGFVRSRIGAPTPSLDATVGYQITVDVSEAGKRIRVTPEWHMNISSESSKTQLIPIGIDERPQLYIEFFEELDKYFKK